MARNFWKTHSRIILIGILCATLNGCTVGPDYVRPCVEVPESFKEAPPGWKFANPCDECDRGDWWALFKDKTLNELMCELNESNQSIATAYAQYLQARALVDEARAAFLPMVTGTASVTRQQNSANGSLSNFSTTGNGGGGTTGGARGSNGAVSNLFTTYLTSLNATWIPDLWGSVQRTVEANVAGAQASAAQVANTRLSMQGSLAQYYFQMRTLDNDQKLLNDTVSDYIKALNITRNRYAAGTAQRLDVLLAQTQLDTAKAQALDNGILRAQYEHAIAVLMGRAPSDITLKPCTSALKPPKIPLKFPSELLERRPDVAQAERMVAEANANVGVAIAAFFPTLTLTGSYGYQSTDLKTLFTKPSNFWSLGSALLQTVYDGGVLIAKKDIACATHMQMVASYRQTVLAAFQNVEDNIVALRILKKEVIVQAEAVRNAEQSLKIWWNQYLAGTAQYSDIVTAQNTLYAARKTLSDLKGREMVSAVGLIMALGGGFDACDICPAGYEYYGVQCPPSAGPCDDKGLCPEFDKTNYKGVMGRF